MEEIKNLMNEQISYMFSHNGEKNTNISELLSQKIDDYCKDDEEMSKIAEVGEIWRDLVIARYNFVVNEIMFNQ